MSVKLMREDMTKIDPGIAVQKPILEPTNHISVERNTITSTEDRHAIFFKSLNAAPDKALGIIR